MRSSQRSRYVALCVLPPPPLTPFQVPLQFLAAEIELQWQSLEQAQPIFEEVAARFTGVPRIDKELLPGGAHNFEFSTNSALLQKKREEFVKSLTKNEE